MGLWPSKGDFFSQGVLYFTFVYHGFPVRLEGVTLFCRKVTFTEEDALFKSGALFGGVYFIWKVSFVGLYFGVFTQVR